MTIELTIHMGDLKRVSMLNNALYERLSRCVCKNNPQEYARRLGQWSECQRAANKFNKPRMLKPNDD